MSTASGVLAPVSSEDDGDGSALLLSPPSALQMSLIVSSPGKTTKRSLSLPPLPPTVLAQQLLRVSSSDADIHGPVSQSHLHPHVHSNSVERDECQQYGRFQVLDVENSPRRGPRTFEVEELDEEKDSSVTSTVQDPASAFSLSDSSNDTSTVITSVSNVPNAQQESGWRIIASAHASLHMQTNVDGDSHSPHPQLDTPSSQHTVHHERTPSIDHSAALRAPTGGGRTRRRSHHTSDSSVDEFVDDHLSENDLSPPSPSTAATTGDEDEEPFGHFSISDLPVLSPGETSNAVSILVDPIPNRCVTLSLSASPAAGIDFTPSTIKFKHDRGDGRASFLISALPSTAAGQVTVKFSLSGPDADRYEKPMRGTLKIITKEEKNKAKLSKLQKASPTPQPSQATSQASSVQPTPITSPSMPTKAKLQDAHRSGRFVVIDESDDVKEGGEDAESELHSQTSEQQSSSADSSNPTSARLTDAHSPHAVVDGRFRRESTNYSPLSPRMMSDESAASAAHSLSSSSSSSPLCIHEAEHFNFHTPPSHSHSSSISSASVPPHITFHSQLPHEIAISQSSYLSPLQSLQLVFSQMLCLIHTNEKLRQENQRLHKENETLRTQMKQTTNGPHTPAPVGVTGNHTPTPAQHPAQAANQHSNQSHTPNPSLHHYSHSAHHTPLQHSQTYSHMHANPTSQLQAHHSPAAEGQPKHKNNVSFQEGPKANGNGHSHHYTGHHRSQNPHQHQHQNHHHHHSHSTQGHSNQAHAHNSRHSPSPANHSVDATEQNHAHGHHQQQALNQPQTQPQAQQNPTQLLVPISPRNQHVAAKTANTTAQSPSRPSSPQVTQQQQAQHLQTTEVQSAPTHPPPLQHSNSGDGNTANTQRTPNRKKTVNDGAAQNQPQQHQQSTKAQALPSKADSPRSPTHPTPPVTPATLPPVKAEVPPKSSGPVHHTSVSASNTPAAMPPSRSLSAKTGGSIPASALLNKSPSINDLMDRALSGICSVSAAAAANAISGGGGLKSMMSPMPDRSKMSSQSHSNLTLLPLQRSVTLMDSSTSTHAAALLAASAHNRVGSPRSSSLNDNQRTNLLNYDPLALASATATHANARDR